MDYGYGRNGAPRPLYVRQAGCPLELRLGGRYSLRLWGEFDIGRVPLPSTPDLTGTLVLILAREFDAKLRIRYRMKIFIPKPVKNAFSVV